MDESSGMIRGILRGVANYAIIAAIVIFGPSTYQGCKDSRPAPTPGPSPAPPVPPLPPAPIPADGLHVLVVFEAADAANYPRDQWNTIYGQEFYDYLNAKCPLGKDGKRHTWRIFDKDTAFAGDEAVWVDAMNRPRQSLPWIVVSNGKTGFEGPLPKTKIEIMTLLKKYGG